MLLPRGPLFVFAPLLVLAAPVAASPRHSAVAPVAKAAPHAAVAPITAPALHVAFAAAAPPAPVPVPASPAASVADSILYATRVTSGGRIGVTLTNYGVLGNNFVSRSPSLEYPNGTGFEHLAHGGLWFGAHAVDDAGAFTGVVTGCLDVAQGSSTPSLTEFTPAGTQVLMRSRLPGPYYDPDAVSEEDLIVTFSDRPAKRAAGNPEDHRPMEILVRQESYSWGWASLRDVIFLRFVITNIGSQALTGAWVGIYTEFASGDKNSYSCWPPSSTCGSTGGWFSKKWLHYEDSLRLVREHYCFGQPVPSGCVLGRVPYWMGLQVLTPPDTLAGQKVTLAAWGWSPGDPLRDQDVERYAIMSAGTIEDLTRPDLMPQTGDPVELLATGPFATIAPGDSIHVDFALVGGADEAEIRQHARIAQQVYDAGYGSAVTPALLSLASADAEPGRVRLVWQGADGAGLFATVERREEARDWTALAEVTADGLGRVAYEDFDVAAGRRYGYRLAVREAGSTAYLGETWVDVPRSAAVALHGIRPNPAARGAFAVSLSLEDGSPATLEVLDLAGRRVWSRHLEGLGAGSHLVRLDGARALRPGLYVLRLAQGARVATARAVLMR